MTKQEQIEERATVISNHSAKYDWNLFEFECKNLAIVLHNLGYRKIDDDCAVITKDDLKLYKKQAVKDTAKEICDLILEHWQGHDLVECDWLIVAISEKYGVDMK